MACFERTCDMRQINHSSRRNAAVSTRPASSAATHRTFFASGKKQTQLLFIYLYGTILCVLLRYLHLTGVDIHTKYSSSNHQPRSAITKHQHEMNEITVVYTSTDCAP